MRDELINLLITVSNKLSKKQGSQRQFSLARATAQPKDPDLYSCEMNLYPYSSTNTSHQRPRTSSFWENTATKLTQHGNDSAALKIVYLQAAKKISDDVIHAKTISDLISHDDFVQESAWSDNAVLAFYQLRSRLSTIALFFALRALENDKLNQNTNEPNETNQMVQSCHNILVRIALTCPETAWQPEKVTIQALNHFIYCLHLKQAINSESISWLETILHHASTELDLNIIFQGKTTSNTSPLDSTDYLKCLFIQIQALLALAFKKDYDQVASLAANFFQLYDELPNNHAESESYAHYLSIDTRPNKQPPASKEQAQKVYEDIRHYQTLYTRQQQKTERNHHRRTRAITHSTKF